MSPDEVPDDPAAPLDESTELLRATARRRLTYVMVLVGVVFAFAVLVAIYMFWVADAIVS